jgi:hypothetical protein
MANCFKAVKMRLILSRGQRKQELFDRKIKGNYSKMKKEELDKLLLLLLLLLLMLLDSGKFFKRNEKEQNRRSRMGVQRRQDLGKRVIHKINIGKVGENSRQVFY